MVILGPLRWLRPLFLGLGALTAGLVAQPARAQPEIAGRLELSDAIVLDQADTAARAHLENIQGQLAGEHWDEAVETLRLVMASHGDQLLAQPDGRFLPVRETCQIELANLPPPALKLYRDRVDSQARRLFEAGVANRDQRPLRQVVEQFFASSWGDDALLALAEIELEQGRYRSARDHWSRVLPVAEWEKIWAVLPPRTATAGYWRQRLEAHQSSTTAGKAALDAKVLGCYPDGAIPPATVWSRLALVSIREGAFEQAAGELAVLERLYPRATGRLAGQEGALAPALTAMLTLARATSPTNAAQDWPTFGGAADRQPPWQPPIVLGGLQWKESLGAAPKADINSQRRYGFPTHRLADDDLALLSVHPLIARQLVLVNNQEKVFAYDLTTGKPAWGGKRAEIYPAAADEPPREPDFVAGTLFRGANMLGAPRYTMTAHGSRVYARLGDIITTSPQIDPRAPRSKSMLVCLDLSKQGKLIWQAPNPRRQGMLIVSDPNAQDDDKWSFEGAPVVDGENVYIAQRRSEIRTQAYIACFDAETGARKWRRRICAGETPGHGEVGEATHGLLTLDGDTLYFNTNLGAVAAVAADDGRIRWITPYRRAQRDLSTEPWYLLRDVNPALCFGSRVFAAPADTDGVLAFDASTGRLLWQSSLPRDAIHVLGAWGDYLVASGERLWVLNVNTGKVDRDQWTARDDRGFVGRGLLAGPLAYLPTETSLEVFDLSTGTWGNSIDLRTPSRGARGGNLALANGYLVIASTQPATSAPESVLFTLHAVPSTPRK